MPKDVLVPPLGQTTAEVTLVHWYKHEGDSVQTGEPLYAIETDKAVLDIEAPASGVLHRVSAADGDKVAVLSVIAVIDAPGTPAGAPVSKPAPAAVVPGAPVSKPIPAAAVSGAPVSEPASSRATTAGASLETGTPKHPFISPRARRLAEVEKLAWEGIPASGPEGAIVERDVRVALERRAAALAQRAEAASTKSAATLTSSPACVTLTSDVDATEILRVLPQLNRSKQTVTLDDLLLHILGRALSANPALNASLVGNVIQQWDRAHIAFAVETEHSLVLPVVHDVAHKGLAALARESKTLADKARAGTLLPEELEGATFTLVDLGAHKVDAFTPLVTSPQTAALGVGRVEARPAVVDGAIVVRQKVWLSLSFDHRLVDGGPAARFLSRVVELIEKPGLLMA